MDCLVPYNDQQGTTHFTLSGDINEKSIEPKISLLKKSQGAIFVSSRYGLLRGFGANVQ